LLASAGLLFLTYVITNSSALRTHENTRSLEKIGSQETRYNIQSGVWKQELQPGERGQRLLSVSGNGVGHLILSFDGLSAFIIGADKVVIDTSWTVEGDYVTFTITDGIPASSFQRVMRLSLDKVTRFHIDDFQTGTMVLRRVEDGEMFRWVLLDVQDTNVDGSQGN